MADRQPTAQERANAFAQLTRQNWQSSPAVAGADSTTIQIPIPKVRLTSKVRLMVTATLNVIHASVATYTPSAFAPFSLIRKVQVDMNNGFSPFTVSGSQLYMYSLMRNNAFTMTRANSGRGKVVQGNVASPTTGTNNTISFLADLPLTLNERDPVGLIVTQNQETTVNITIDFAAAATLGDATAGYTYALSNISVIPIVESFTVPALQTAVPDISVIKLVNASREVISGSGVKSVSLPTGTTYRKMAFFIEDAAGLGVTDASLTGNMELVFNQADTPYRLTAAQLAAINHEQFGVVLPQGMFAFDFSYQGLANYGGARDYIDTERLTEFWLRFNAAVAGNVTVVYETLSRLRG